jgi:hypothetical protein
MTPTQAPTGPTASAGLQPCKVEPNNKSNDRRTNEEEAPTEPVNNVCSFNDDEIAFQAQNKYETYNVYSTGGGQQYCPNSLQCCMENFEEKCTPRSLFR